MKLTSCCLFIDDDVFMQKAFTRMAQRIRPTWCFVAADDPVNWQKSLADKQPDIVVCDYLMPGIRGDQILERIAALFPLAVRVLLTGDMRDEVLCNVSSLAHYVLSKPYQQQTLVELFENVERLKSLPISLRGREILSQVGSIIPRPQVLLSFEQTIHREDASIEDVVPIIEHEPEIAAKLLQLANSPFMGFHRQTYSLAEAIKRMGLTITHAVITKLAMAGPDCLMLDETVHDKLSGAIFERACCARSLAITLGYKGEAIELIFTAAVLLGLGELALASPQLQALLSKDTSGELDSPVIIALYLLALWSYPANIIDVLKALHDMQYTHIKEPSVAAVLFIAGKLCETSAALVMQHLNEASRSSFSNAIKQWEHTTSPHAE